MAMRGGSGKSSFQDLCALPNPSKDSWPSLKKRLLEAKSHLLALRPANPEAVTDFMIAMQFHTFPKEGTKIPDDKYREAFRLILDDVEQEFDASGQLGPLSLAKMKEFGSKLQVTLQSSCLSEVPPKVATVNELADMQARLRKLQSGGGGKPPDKPPPNKPTPAAVVPWSWERAWQWGKGCAHWSTRAHSTYGEMFRVWASGLQAVDVPQRQSRCAKGACGKKSRV
jgi:hypothetical protein